MVMHISGRRVILLGAADPEILVVAPTLDPEHQNARHPLNTADLPFIRFPE